MGDFVVQVLLAGSKASTTLSWLPLEFPDHVQNIADDSPRERTAQSASQDRPSS